MSAPGSTGCHRGPAPQRVDAALWGTIALLEMVRREEQVLVGLRRCVVELEAISRARSALADRTDSEVVEAWQRMHGRADADPSASTEQGR